MGAGRADEGRADDRHRRLQAVLSAVVADDPRGIVVRDARGEVIEANQAARRLLARGDGAERIDGVGPSIRGDVVDERRRRVPPEQLPDEVAWRTGTRVTDLVLGLSGPEGVLRWLEVTCLPVETEDGRWVVTHLRDVTAETAAVVDLQRLAAVDPLTGVGNRRLLEWTVDDLIDPDEHVGVVLLDIDQFKAVNDAHGHDVGDEVLRQIAERVGAVCRPDDVTVRLGGDEFLVVLRRLDERADALELVSRIARALRAPYVTEAGLLEVTCSLGWTSGSAVSAMALVREADRRMYEIKHSGQLNLLD